MNGTPPLTKSRPYGHAVCYTRAFRLLVFPFWPRKGPAESPRIRTLGAKEEKPRQNPK